MSTHRLTVVPGQNLGINEAQSLNLWYFTGQVHHFSVVPAASPDVVINPLYGNLILEPITMPHSPYHTTVCQPVTDGDIDEYKQELTRHRIELEQGETDKYRPEALLEIGGAFVEYCEFLETKLNIKVRTYLIYMSVNRIANGACLRPM